MMDFKLGMVICDEFFLAPRFLGQMHAAGVGFLMTPALIHQIFS